MNRVLIGTISIFIFSICGCNSDNLLGRDIQIESVNISKDSLSVLVSQQEQLSVEIEPSNASEQDILWETSDPLIVSINNKGQIKGINSGSAIITVKSVDGSIYDICSVTVPTTVFVSGCYSVDTIPEICYWINDQKYILSAPANYYLVYRTYISVNDGNVYLSSTYKIGGKQVPCYWENNTFSTLELPLGSVEGYSKNICVTNQSIVIIGSYINKNGEQKPCIWINGEISDLPIPINSEGDVSKLFIDTDNIYIAGYYKNSENQIPCYWLNGMMYNLPLSGSNGSTENIEIINNNVYVTGSQWELTPSYYNYSTSCYWKNGIQVILPLSEIEVLFSNGGKISGIFEEGNNTIILGYALCSTLSNYWYVPCMWINNEYASGLWNRGFVADTCMFNNDQYIVGVDNSSGTRSGCYMINTVKHIFPEKLGTAAFSICIR